MNLKELKEEIEKKYPSTKVVGFNEKQANDFKLLGELNNQYVALIAQYDQLKRNLLTINEIIVSLKTDKVPIGSIMKPFGIGLFRIVQPSEKDEVIDAHMKFLEQETVKINGVLGQLQHKGDALGEQRMRTIHSILSILINQHSYTIKDVLNQIGTWFNIKVDVTQITPPSVEDKMKQIVSDAAGKQNV